MTDLAFRTFTTYVMKQMNVIKVTKDDRVSVKLALDEFFAKELISVRTKEANDR